MVIFQDLTSDPLAVLPVLQLVETNVWRCRNAFTHLNKDSSRDCKESCWSRITMDEEGTEGWGGRERRGEGVESGREGERIKGKKEREKEI